MEEVIQRLRAQETLSRNTRENDIPGIKEKINNIEKRVEQSDILSRSYNVRISGFNPINSSAFENHDKMIAVKVNLKSTRMQCL
ncbi:unnamed protein product [Enterobius vermicularis]|uniref:t-SNARE coiled-coil homology domain-containing protein n=1 Tax=Enterobius vermicularis TaxID=51028 RepID=A0A0N4VRN0_ENTVE|nr:unnamed protein product [Enterobius vermicularis]